VTSSSKSVAETVEKQARGRLRYYVPRNSLKSCWPGRRASPICRVG